MFKSCPSVHATDDQVGEVHSVVLDPKTHEVEQFIVKYGRASWSEYRLITPQQVDHVDADGTVTLTINKETFEAAPKFTREVVDSEIEADTDDDLLVWGDVYGVLTEGTTEYSNPLTIEGGLDVDALLVGKGAKVYTELGEHEGKIECLVLSSDARGLRYLVIRLKGIRRKHVVVEAARVKDWQPGAVVLDMDAEALKSQPSKLPAA